MQSVGVRQTWSLALFISAVVIAIPLFTYKTSDAGWMSATYPVTPVRNLFGANGAWFADACFSLFGYFALLLPLLFVCAGVAQALGRRSYFMWRLPLAFVLLWCSGTLLCSLHFPNFIPLPVSTGGLLGLHMAALTLPYASLELVTLPAIFLFCWGASLLLGFSWMRLAESCGAVFVLLFRMVYPAARPVIADSSFGSDENAMQNQQRLHDQPEQQQAEADQTPRFAKMRKLAANMFDSEPMRPHRNEPDLGDIDQPLDEKLPPVTHNDNALYTEAHPRYRSRLDVVNHLRKVYTENMGELSEDLQATLAQIQQEHTETEDQPEEEVQPPAPDAALETAPAQDAGLIDDRSPLVSENDDDIQAAGHAGEEGQAGEPPLMPFAPSENETPKDQNAEVDAEQPAHTTRIVFDAAEDFELPEPQDDWELEEDAPGSEEQDTQQQTSDEEGTQPPVATTGATAIPEGPSALVQAVPYQKPEYRLPEVDLLEASEKGSKIEHDTEKLQQLGTLLEQNLADFGIKAEVEEIHPGPVVTRFEITPAPGVKVVRITNLVKDIARSMSVPAVRIVEVIAGRSTIGIEVPNPKRAMVRLSEVIGSSVFTETKGRLPLALGCDIQGRPVVIPLEKTPHLLVAGTTGSGKSVGVNAMLVSLLYRLDPEQLRLLLIDPKMLELSVYNGIPHLLSPVITDMKDAANGLKWCVAEMERRYRLMSKLGVRNLDGYNHKIKHANEPIRDPLQTDPEGNATLTTLPHLVVIIDEFADMMMIVGKKVEELIARIAQKARAAGIHMILATQRPSVDVITGLIKANVPTRIAFQVSSKIDSRTILDQTGAEQLLGNGDMLFLPPGQGVPQRVHGAFISDEEVHRVVDYWKDQDGPDYISDITRDPEEANESEGSAEAENENGDELFDEAVNFIHETQRVSISLLQRKFKIGYNRAARIIDSMEEQGMVSAMESNGKREIIQQ